MQQIAKSPTERQMIAALQAAVRDYRGAITVCPPGVARGHEERPDYAADDRRDGPAR